MSRGMSEAERTGKAGNPYASLCMCCYARSVAVYDGKDCPHCGAVRGLTLKRSQAADGAPSETGEANRARIDTMLDEAHARHAERFGDATPNPGSTTR